MYDVSYRETLVVHDIVEDAPGFDGAYATVTGGWAVSERFPVRCKQYACMHVAYLTGKRPGQRMQRYAWARYRRQQGTRPLLPPQCVAAGGGDE
jgi:hypothetical protein